MPINETLSDTKTIYRQKLSIGRGSIEPAPHVERGDYEWSLVDRLENDLLYDPELYEKVELAIPVQCADGRTRWLSGASAIGGTFSSVAADALGPRKYYDENANAKQHALSIYSKFRAKGIAIGGHVDDHATGDNCGCGGEDRFGGDGNSLCVLGMLAENGNDVRSAIEGLLDSRTGMNLGIEITDEDHSMIIKNAIELDARNNQENKYYTNGRDLRDAFIEAQDESVIETLHGEHKEVIAVLDLRMTKLALNRAKIAERFDDQLQAFYINVPALQTAANELYDDQSEVRFAFISALYYNVAASAVLAGPSLRLLTLV